MKIVKIGAMWCPGCLVMHKVWDRVEKECDVEVISYDLDMDSEEVEKYEVGSTLPVIIFYDNEHEYKRLVGEKTFDDINNVIQEMRNK